MNAGDIDDGGAGIIRTPAWDLLGSEEGDTFPDIDDLAGAEIVVEGAKP